jgi:hypothetical protein
MIKRCIRCRLPITFAWIEIPIVTDGRGQSLYVAFAHPSTTGCQAEQLRASQQPPAADPPARNTHAKP